MTDEQAETVEQARYMVNNPSAWDTFDQGASDIIAKLVAALSPARDETEREDFYTMPAHGWTCFHCGETFTTPGSARAHFGFDPSHEPACRIKLGAERGLVMALRNAEKDAADAWTAIASETTEAAKAYYAQANRHREQIMAAEEAGYEKGLADGLALNKSASLKEDEAEREDVCAACRGMRGDLARGREPEELCDPCYDDAERAAIAALSRSDVAEEDEVERGARAIHAWAYGKLHPVDPWEADWDQCSEATRQYLRDYARAAIAALTSADEVERVAEERDALLGALGFKPGPFRSELSRKVILDDAAGLRPAMVEARGRANEAEANAAFKQWLLDEEIHGSRSGLLLRLWSALKDARRENHKLAAHNVGEPSDELIDSIMQAVCDPGSFVGFKGEDRTLNKWQRDALRVALNGSGHAA